MMDPYLCCLLGLCCPPFSVEQMDKLIKLLLERGVATTREIAKKIAEHDLALVANARASVAQLLGSPKDS